MKENIYSLPRHFYSFGLLTGDYTDSGAITPRGVISNSEIKIPRSQPP